VPGTVTYRGREIVATVPICLVWRVYFEQWRRCGGTMTDGLSAFNHLTERLKHGSLVLVPDQGAIIMMQQLCAFTERANASAARVVDDASAPFGTSTTTLGNTAWNSMPSVHTSAICTHGKFYERRLQEMLT